MTKTVSLETAKLLKEAGWVQGQEGKVWIVPTPREMAGTEPLLFDYDADDKVNEQIAAPDTTELLEALPMVALSIVLGKQMDEADGKTFWYVHAKQMKERRKIWRDTPAEALASLWLELRKQKII